jgi:hypothetical protein
MAHARCSSKSSAGILVKPSGWTIIFESDLPAVWFGRISDITCSCQRLT